MDEKQERYQDKNIVGGGHDEYPNMQASLVSYRRKVTERFPDLRYTSGYRENAKTSTGGISTHAVGGAWDIENRKDYYNHAWNTKEGILELVSHNLGILDETTEAMMKKTGATGPHYHVSNSAAAVKRTRERYTELYGKPYEGTKDAKYYNETGRDAHHYDTPSDLEFPDFRDYVQAKEAQQEVINDVAAKQVKQTKEQQFRDELLNIFSKDTTSTQEEPIQRRQGIAPAELRVEENEYYQGQFQEGGCTDCNKKKYQSGGETSSLPIYNNKLDFLEQNKDRTTSMPFYNEKTDTLDYRDEPLFREGRSHNSLGYSKEIVQSAYLVEDIKNKAGKTLCLKEQCTANSNRVIDGMIEGTTFFKSSQDFKKDTNTAFSTIGEPTVEQKAKYPHFMGDVNFGSLDAWDIAPAAKRLNPDLVIFDSSSLDKAEIDKNSLNFEGFMKDYKDKVVIGAYINTGVRGQYLEGVGYTSQHSLRVVGFTPEGEPLVSDSGQIKELRDTGYLRNGAKGIISITNIPGKEKFTFKHFKERHDKLNSVNKEVYLTDLDNLPNVDSKGDVTGSTPASEDYKEFHTAISENKNYIVGSLGLSEKKYDQYAKIALTLGGTETNYGNGKVYNALDWLGDSTGVAQITEENVDKKHAKVLDKFDKGSAQYNAMATMLYISDLDKYKDKWMELGSKPRERKYTRRDEESLKNVVRGAQGREQSGYINSDEGNQDRLRIEVDKKNINLSLPYNQWWQSKDSYRDEVNTYLKGEGLEGKVRFDYDDKGNKSFYKKTKGNTIPNTLEDFVFYAWQAPNTIASGDAQGDSNYYKKNKARYKLLFSKENRSLASN